MLLNLKTDPLEKCYETLEIVMLTVHPSPIETPSLRGSSGGFQILKYALKTKKECYEAVLGFKMCELEG